MEHVLETSIFDEITFAKNEATLNVLDALIMEYDKLDAIMQGSERANEFQIVQESFTKPSKNEGALTKIALAVPRAIYALIKAIVDGFKRAFGNKNRVSAETIEHASKVVENLTGNEEVMKLVCGAVVGTASAVGLFLKARYNAAKKKITDTVNEHRETRDTKASIRSTFENEKSAAKAAIENMAGLYVNEKDEVGIILFTDLDEIRTEGVKKYLSGIKTHVENVCNGRYTSKREFNSNMDKALFDIEHNFTLFTYMRPYKDDATDYTMSEYQTAMSMFGKDTFTNIIDKYMNDIAERIVTVYKGFESSSKKADEKEEKFEEQVKKNYGEEIVKIVNERIMFLQNWLIDLDKFITTAINEYNKKMKSEVAKLEPNVHLDDFEKERWLKDKAKKDEVRNKKDEKKSEDSDEKKESDDDKKPSEESESKEEDKEEKKDDDKKDEKEEK